MSVRLLRKVDNSLLEIIVLDATLSYGITRQAEVSEYPIESGSLVSDHVQTKPVDVTVAGFVSNNPVGLLSFGTVPQQDNTRAKSAYDALVQTFVNKELVQIQGELEVFDDMAMTSLDCPRDRSNRNALQFTAEFKQLTKVGTQIVELSEDVAELAAPEQELGKQTPADANTEETTEASVFLRTLQGLGVLE